MTDDLHRTNINLYASDVRFLRAQYGFGWTERVRDWVAKEVRALKIAHGAQIHGEISRRYVDNTEIQSDD